MKFPGLLDVYIKNKEQDAEKAGKESAEKVTLIDGVLKEAGRAIQMLAEDGDLFSSPPPEGSSPNSFIESIARCRAFKNYVENKDGYRALNRSDGSKAKETEVQLFFGLIWHSSHFDVNRETNNGRGPVDFAISFGKKDKSLIELKLASSKSLKKNLENQLAIYGQANDTKFSIFLIVYYEERELRKIEKVLQDLQLKGSEKIILVDARKDNKPSASIATES